MTTRKKSRADTKMVGDQNQLEGELKQKCEKIAELHKGMTILKERMSDAKSDILSYIKKHPTIDPNINIKIGDRSIKYVNRKTYDNMSQKLVVKGLTRYFSENKEENVKQKVAQAIETILSERKQSFSQSIDISISGKSLVQDE
jgi:hypothetical protein